MFLKSKSYTSPVLVLSQKRRRAELRGKRVSSTTQLESHLGQLFRDFIYFFGVRVETPIHHASVLHTLWCEFVNCEFRDSIQNTND